MSTGAVVCSSCGYENIVVGCGFCLQCGEEFPALTTIEEEVTAQDSDITSRDSSLDKDGAAACVQEAAAVAAPTSEAVFATVADASQYVGYGDSAYSADSLFEGFRIEPRIPAGGTEVFQSALLAAEENDSSFEETASAGDESTVATADFDERSSEPAENLSGQNRSNELVEQAAKTDEPESQTVEELVEQAAEKREPTFEAYESAAEMREPALEAFEPAAEGEPAFEAYESAAETREPALEAFEPAAEKSEATLEAYESAAETREPAFEASEPADESFEAAVETSEQVESLENADEAIGSAIEAFEPTVQTFEQVDDGTELAVEASGPTCEESEPLDETHTPTGENGEVACENTEEAGEPRDDMSEPATGSESTQVGSAIAAVTEEADSVEEAEIEEGEIEEAEINEAEIEEGEIEEAEINEAEIDEADLAFADALFHELDRLVTTAAQSIGLQMNSAENGMVGELEIEGRKRHVYVQRNYSSSGTPMMSFFAACGPASHQHAVPLLEWNSALPRCAFAIREIENTPMFVTQANLPAFSLDPMTIAATFKEIVKRADQVQQRIG